MGVPSGYSNRYRRFPAFLICCLYSVYAHSCSDLEVLHNLLSYGDIVKLNCLNVAAALPPPRTPAHEQDDWEDNRPPSVNDGRVTPEEEEYEEEEEEEEEGENEVRIYIYDWNLVLVNSNVVESS